MIELKYGAELEAQVRRFLTNALEITGQAVDLEFIKGHAAARGVADLPTGLFGEIN